MGQNLASPHQPSQPKKSKKGDTKTPASGLFTHRMEETEDLPMWIGAPHHGIQEVNAGSAKQIRVCVSTNQIVEIDKLYGPLCSAGVRIFLDYEGDRADWVVEAENLITEKWEEKARWYCQENWPKDDDSD